MKNAADAAENRGLVELQNEQLDRIAAGLTLIPPGLGVAISVPPNPILPAFVPSLLERVAVPFRASD
jgi:hypothetical protein